MAAGLGFKTFTSGEVLTAADTNGYLMQGVMVFANASARTAAITAPTEGQYSYLKDTNSTEYYDGSAWVAGVEGDISGVTAGVGISGGGTSGTVTVTNSMATTITTKGDLVPGTGSGTFARLAVGNNGETLVADSSTSTGLRYQSAYNGNACINGGMDIWQRGTSAAGSYPTYLADRWMNYRAVAGSTYSRQNTSDTTNLPFIQYCQRVLRDTGNTATNPLYISQSLENDQSRMFVGQTVTLSWYARAGANFSATSSNMGYELVYGTGTNQNVIAGFTGQTNVTSGTKTLTTTWQRFSVTGTVASTATQLAINLFYTPVGTAGAADYMEVTGVQLELGSVATTFKRAGGTIQGETSACQRYYWRSTGGSVYSTYGQGPAASTTGVQLFLQYPVTMRVNPTSVDFANLGLSDSVNSAIAVGSITLLYMSPFAAMLAVGVASGLTQFRLYQMINNNSTAGYLGFSAEL